MERRDIAKTLLAAAGATALAERSEAQTCTPPCYVRTAAEIAAGITPTNTTYPANGPIDVRRYGYSADGQTSSAIMNTVALISAINVASAAVGGATGATVLLPTGIAYIASKIPGPNNTFVKTDIVLPNRVRLQGQNASGSILKATSDFSPATQPYMFWANNGTTAMFDSILQDLFIDCSDVVGLGGILTDAWQENSGLRSVGIMNFTTYGLRFRNVFAGGQSTCELQGVQFFASSLGATAGIRVDQISSVGGFLVHVRDTVIAGGSTGVIARGIDIVNDSLLLQNVHFENCTDGVYLDGVGSHTLQQITGISGTGTTTLVRAAATFSGRLTMTGCSRNGATNFLVNEASGETYTSPDLAEYAFPDIKAQNTAKAWCLFNGTLPGTNPPTAGSNVASVQRISTGRYRVNLLNYTQNANIAMFVSSNQGAPGANNWCQAASIAYFLVNLDVAGVPTDANEVHVVAFAL